MVKRYFLFGLICLWILSSTWPVLAEGPSRIERTNASGMSIMLQKNQSEVAQIVLLLKSGSGLEPADKKGIAQIMNNIVYWILQSDSKDSIGSVDVQTNPDYTVINLTTLARNTRPVLEKIKFLLSEPIYSYDDVVDLQKYTRSRIKSRVGIIQPYIRFTQEFYNTVLPYNDWPSQKSLNAITGADVYQWYRQTYQPGNAVLSISGKIPQNISDVEKFFSAIKSESVDHRLLVAPVLLTESKQIEQEDQNSKAASVCIGFAAPPIRDPDYPAFKLITFYLGDYFEYFDELRLKYGLFYTPVVFSNELEKPSAPNLVLISMTDSDHVKMVESESFKLTTRLIEKGIEQEEIAKVLTAMKAADEANQASGANIAFLNAVSYYLRTQLVYTDALWPKLQQLKTEDIKRVAAKYLKNYIQVVYNPKQIAADL
jgi:zinc protease